MRSFAAAIAEKEAEFFTDLIQAPNHTGFGK
jgi:hypothetical protein